MDAARLSALGRPQVFVSSISNLARSLPAVSQLSFFTSFTDGKNTDCCNIKLERRNFGYTPAALCIGVDD